MQIVPVEKIPTGQFINVSDETWEICLKMEKLCEEQQGIGLSAVQMGLPYNLFVIKFEKNYEYFVNCKYTPLGDEKIYSIEGCLSLRNEKGVIRHFKVSRFKNINVSGFKLLKNSQNELKLSEFNENFNCDDFYCIVFQHEIDHGMGILISQGEELRNNSEAS